MQPLSTSLTRRLALAGLLLLLLTGGSVGAGGAPHVGPHWGYTGEHGPAHWAHLAAGFGTCAKGARQAPIDIIPTLDLDLPPLELHYQIGGRNEVNNGHTIQIDYESGSFIRLDGRDYMLKQFHFHAPSENHIGGRAFPLEAHFVHQDVDGRLAVLAVMFAEGRANAPLAVAWADMPQRPHSYHELLTRAAAAALLPADHDYYRFEGSLTTPPCTEGVAWVVLKQPVTASREQIMAFARVMVHPNNRPLQALNAREILQ